MENKNTSDFIKKAYQKGKIKNLDEAFIDYPVNEEWHKGKIENLLKEDDNEYNDKYNVGDIVFVNRYCYSNGAKGENHLFVIIDRNNMAVPIENFGMLISSNLEKLKYKSNIFIQKNNKNGLKRDSIVKTDVVYKILDSQIVFKIGNVDEERISEYKEAYLNT